MEERIKLINPDCKVTPLHMFYTEETYEDLFNNYEIDYFIDASDTIIYKVHLMRECFERESKSYRVWELQIKQIQRALKLKIYLRHTWIQWLKLLEINLEG